MWLEIKGIRSAQRAPTFAEKEVVMLAKVQIVQHFALCAVACAVCFVSLRAQVQRKLWSLLTSG